MRLFAIFAQLIREQGILAVQDGYNVVAKHTYKDLPDSVLICPKEATSIEPFMYEGYDYAFVEGVNIARYNIAVFGRQWRQGLTCYYASSYPVLKNLFNVCETNKSLVPIDFNDLDTAGAVLYQISTFAMTSPRDTNNLIWYKNKKGELRLMENGVRDKKPDLFTKGKVAHLQAQLAQRI